MVRTMLRCEELCRWSWSSQSPTFAKRNCTGQGRAWFNIDRVSAKRYILLGGVVGAFVAIAFSLALWFQFDAAGTELVVIASLPVCALLGALFGWVWWRMLGRK